MRHIVVSVALAAMFLQVSLLAAPQVAGTPAPPPTAAGQTAAAPAQTVLGGSVQTTTSSAQATINGTVVTPNGEPIANTTVRARDLLTGEIGGSTRTSTTGEYSISLKPGSYVLEIVDDAGQIIGVSSFVSAAAGVSLAAATVMAASGALSAAVGTATGLAAALGATAARSVGMAAAAAGVAGVVVPPGVPVASPSR